MSRIRARLDVVGVALLTLAFAAPPLAAADPAPPSGSAPAVTVEEARLDRAVPQEILRRSGFDTVAPRFAEVLQGASSYRQDSVAALDQGSFPESYGELGCHQPSMRSSTTDHDSFSELPFLLRGEAGRSIRFSMDSRPPPG